MGEYPSADSLDTPEPFGKPPSKRSPELPAGTIIDGKYRVERTLGEGGMGVVVAATRIESHELVAIKILRAEERSDRDSLARFEREARAVMKIGGEHVARILDFGALESGAPYIAMEYLEGDDLAKVLKRRGPLPLEEAVDYIAQACEALAEAHAVGIVHRDLKPGNLFLTRGAGGEPHIKLLDFGIAKTIGAALGEGEATLTTTESFIGSPVYMSPEQMITPKKVDCRADVWAIGVTLYRLLSRKVPFDGESPMEVCGMIMAGARPISLREVRAEVPWGLDMAVLKCLSREPVDRFRNVAEFAEAIAPFGTPAASASAARARERLEDVPSAWDTLSSPLLPRIEPRTMVVDPDAIETLTARTLSTVAAPRARGLRTGRRNLILAVAGGALAACAVFALRAMRDAAPPPSAAAVASSPVENPLGAAPSKPSDSTTASSIASAAPSDTPPAAASSAPAKTAAARGSRPKADPSAATAASATAAPAEAAPAPTSLPGGVFGGKPF